MQPEHSGITEAEAEEVDRRTWVLWEHPKLKLYDEQIRVLLLAFRRHHTEFGACKHKPVDLPTSSTAWKPLNMNWLCQAKVNISECRPTLQGEGTKEVVIIGNSLARDLYQGFQYVFKDVYSNLTVVAREACTPFLSEQGRMHELCNNVSMRKTTRTILLFTISIHT